MPGKRFFLTLAGLLILTGPCFSAAAGKTGGSNTFSPLEVVWPTPNKAFFFGKSADDFIQPTSSGTVESGLFGCYRNNGNRFHEGIDIKPLRRSPGGDARDEVYASIDGTIAYINRKAETSSYGNYIVIEHPQLSTSLYTLYAHLKTISGGIRVGQTVRAGIKLGMMGRTASGYAIPRNRSHLHFEIGLRLSENFQSWYDWMKFDDLNPHGNFNGMNLLGFDPLDFLEKVREKELRSVESYLQSLPEAFTLQVTTAKTPSFIQRNPSLREGEINPGMTLQGWQITFSRWGVPFRWVPLQNGKRSGLSSPGTISLLNYNVQELGTMACQKTVFLREGSAELGPGLRQTLQLLFDFR